MGTSPGEELGSAVLVFLEKTRLEGWAIGLMGNFCPAHVRQLREQQSRLVLPDGGTILTPGGMTQ